MLLISYLIQLAELEGMNLLKDIKRDQSIIRLHHSLELFKIIKQAKAISRADIAKSTNMSGTSVGRIIKDLIEQGLVLEKGQTKGNVGRKATLLEINPHGVLIAGISLEVTGVQVGIVDLYGRIVAQSVKAFDLSRGADAVLDDVVEQMEAMIKSVGLLSEKIVGIGVSIPGIVSWPEGEVKAIPQFNWKNIKVKEYLEKRMNKAVFVDNQVKAALMGESLFGSVAGAKNAVCIWVGSGVGGAVLEDGVVARGSKNAMGEIGHTTVDPGGPLCDCGRFGCLQTFVCSSALEKASGRSMQDIFAAERRMEPWAVSMIDRAAEYFAMAISNVLCMYNPEVVLLAGSMVEEWPEWMKRVEEKHYKYIWEPLNDSFKICYANLGENLGIIGASSIVVREILQSPIQ